jgi:hypothetical protein
MITNSALARLAVGAAVAAVLAACSGGTAQGPTAAVANSPALEHQTHGLGPFLASGIDSRYAGVLSSIPERPDNTGTVERDLFVSDGQSTVHIFKNKTYQKAGSISGLLLADGLWVDQLGNLYVADPYEQSVQEYAPGTTSPKCTYSSRLVDPINVLSDVDGNVYVADFEAHNVDVFPQCENKISKRFPVQQPEGIAVDTKGDLFVSEVNPDYSGSFVEFKNGKRTATMLGATVRSPGGLAIDKNGNLIAVDQTGSIDIIVPPYSSAIVLVSEPGRPFHVSLNKAENLIFTANLNYPGLTSVTIYSYPPGSLVKTIIGRENGFDDAVGIVDSPNAVF